MSGKDRLMEAAKKGYVGKDSKSEDTMKVNIGFSGNIPQAYTKEEYILEAEHIRNIRMMQIDRKNDARSMEDGKDYGCTPVDTQVCLEFVRPNGTISMYVDIYPDVPKWDTIMVMNKLSYNALQELSCSIGTVDNVLWYYIIAGIKAGLAS